MSLLFRTSRNEVRSPMSTRKAGGGNYCFHPEEYVIDRGPSYVGTSFLSIPLRVPLRYLGGIHKRACHRSASDLCHAVVRRHAEGKEPPMDRFQRRLGFYVRANRSGSAMLDVDRRAHADLSFVTVRQHGVGSSPLHQPDHVGRGINWGQGLVVRAKGVTMLHRLLRVATNANRNLFCHGENLSNPQPATKSCAAILQSEW